MKRNPIKRLKIQRETLQILESSLRQAGGGARFAGEGSDDGTWTGCCCTTVTTNDQ